MGIGPGMKRYQHIIWDWNGTLLDDVALCVEVMNGMLNRRGMRPIDAAGYRELFGFPVRGYYQRLGFDFGVESFEQLAVEYCDEYDARVHECDLHRGAVSVIGALGQAASAQSILSSCEQRALDRALCSFGLDGHFQDIIGQSDRYAAGKVETGRALIRRSGITESGTVLVGDTLHDHEVAQALGIDCILVAHGHHSRRRLAAAHPAVIESLEPIGSITA